MKTFSTEEYSIEEIKQNGNQLKGGKLHDKICNYVQSSYGLSENEINNTSVAVWIAIHSKEKQILELKELVKEASDKLKARENRLERFKRYMADSMKAAGVDVIDAGFLTAKLLHERDESIELNEGAEFPPELCNAPKPPEPSKTKIKAAILAGEAVAGARIVRRDRLEIK